MNLFYLFLFYVALESEYYTYKDLNEALISGEIQGILVDTYIVTSHPELFTVQSGSYRFTRQLLPYESVYGVALGRKVDKLSKCFDEYLKFKKDKVSRTIEKNLEKTSVSLVAFLILFYSIFMRKHSSV